MPPGAHLEMISRGQNGDTHSLSVIIQSNIDKECVSPFLEGWEVPDMTRAVQALHAKGVVMTIYEGFGQDALGIWTSPDGKTKVAWFTDPDGNVLSLAQH